MMVFSYFLDIWEKKTQLSSLGLLVSFREATAIVMRIRVMNLYLLELKTHQLFLYSNLYSHSLFKNALGSYFFDQVNYHI